MAYKSESRNGASIRYLAVHTAEGAQTVQSLASFFSRPDAQGSSHVGIDADETFVMVPDYRASWTLRLGNSISLNAELCAFAEMSRQQWLSEADISFNSKALRGQRVTVSRPRDQLRRLSAWLAAKSVQYGVPLVKLTPLQVARNESGVIGHVDWTVGKKDGTHTDPGDGFPWDVVMADARAILNPAAAPTHPEEEDNMITVVIPAFAPPPVDEQVEGVDYTLRYGIPLPPGQAYECSIQSSGVVNLGHWYWTQQGADGSLVTPAMDRLTTNRMGIGRFDLQPGYRHTYRGHENFSGVDIRIFRATQPLVVVLRPVK